MAAKPVAEYPDTGWRCALFHNGNLLSSNYPNIFELTYTPSHSAQRTEQYPIPKTANCGSVRCTLDNLSTFLVSSICTFLYFAWTVTILVYWLTRRRLRSCLVSYCGYTCEAVLDLRAILKPDRIFVAATAAFKNVKLRQNTTNRPADGASFAALVPLCILHLQIYNAICKMGL